MGLLWSDFRSQNKHEAFLLFLFAAHAEPSSSAPCLDMSRLKARLNFPHLIHMSWGISGQRGVSGDTPTRGA